MTVLRRSAAVLAATAVIGAATPALTATAADDPSPSASTKLTGEGGLLQQLTKRVLESALEG
ncbi:hypothetical protein AB0D38_44025, partial [Streptomyces sp. NPDC048279]